MSKHKMLWAVAMTAAIGRPASAADFAWVPFAGGTYSWNDAANWSPAGVPQVAGDSAAITGAVTGSNLLINLATNVSLGTLTLGATGSAFETEIGSVGGVLTFDPAATVNSQGIAGAVNRISARVVLNGNLTLPATSTNGLTLGGALSQFGANRSIVNNLPAGSSLVISGPVDLSESAATALRILTITGSGTTVMNGAFNNGAGTLLGAVTISATNAGAPRPTVVLNAPNNQSTATTFNRGTLVLGHDGVFGTGTFTFGGQSAFFARNVLSTADNRTIANPVALANHLTVTGTQSLTFTGLLFQTNTRTVMNNLPAGKTLNINGATLALASDINSRTMTFDGSGLTVITSFIRNSLDVDFDDQLNGQVAKNGTGVLMLSGGGSYRGGSIVNGGLMQFSTLAAMANSATVLVNAGGAMGLVSGSLDAGFLAKITAALTPSNGGLALSPADSAINIDYVAGALAGANTVGMSLGAVASGASYTGTITPDPVRGYRLGGGGSLQLANANALTGADAVTITNGGTVHLAQANNYSGATTITGQWIIPTQQQAALDGQTALDQTAAAVRVNTALSIANVAALGVSGEGAGNLVLNGGILRYTGPTADTGRLFTIAPNGATLDASGTGAIGFINSASPAVTDAPAGTGSIVVGSVISGVNDTSNLALGMTVAGPNLPAGATIIGITPNQIRLSGSGTAATAGASISFGAQNRNLTLTGVNTDDNTLGATLVDSPTGKLGVVKNGPGNWRLTTAGSTYTGGTTVNAGTLSVRRILGNGTTTINGGTLRIAPGTSAGDTTATSVFPEGQFTIAGGATPAGRLDVGKQGVVFDYAGVSPEATIRSLILSGRAGGAWTGNGIASADAADAPTSHAVGYAEASDIGSPATFLGQTIDSTAVLVRYTRVGDANLDGTAGIGDFSLLGANFNQPGEWVSGDFNYDGQTNIGDFSLLGSNFNQSAAGGLPRGVVPEPGGLGLMASAGVFLRQRRSVR